MQHLPSGRVLCSRRRDPQPLAKVKHMPLTITEVQRTEIEALMPLLLLADEYEPGLRWGLAHLVDAVYRVEQAGQLVGAVTLQWRNDPSEIMELAIDPALQGQGLGKACLAWIVEEAIRRGKQALLVGTANSSLGNIAFYQKAGFRMDHVRRDYFWYYPEPIYEHGIRVQDMLVFRRELRLSDDHSRR